MKMKEVKIDQLKVYVYETRQAMGEAAGKEAASLINQIIEEKGEANVVFAAAPSQNDLIAQLLEEAVDWTRVRAFQQDEYIGISADEPAGFGNFLKMALYDKLPFKSVHYLYAPDNAVEETMRDYERLLTEHPIDLIFLGVGENGHLAFNDPPVADFEDPLLIKTVELDPVFRQQQVNDGCFPGLDKVPTHAFTLTLSFIRSVPRAICVVPTRLKAEAIQNTLEGPISEACPATLLRLMPQAALYLDKESASLAFPELADSE